MEMLVDILGWAGSVAILLAYGLNSYQKLRSDSMVFYMLNLVGGIFLIVYALEKDALANAFINVVWVVIAVVAIGKRFLKKSNA